MTIFGTTLYVKSLNSSWETTEHDRLVDFIRHFRNMQATVFELRVLAVALGAGAALAVVPSTVGLDAVRVVDVVEVGLA